MFPCTCRQCNIFLLDLGAGGPELPPRCLAPASDPTASAAAPAPTCTSAAATTAHGRPRSAEAAGYMDDSDGDDDEHGDGRGEWVEARGGHASSTSRQLGQPQLLVGVCEAVQAAREWAADAHLSKMKMLVMHVGRSSNARY